MAMETQTSGPEIGNSYYVKRLDNSMCKLD